MSFELSALYFDKRWFLLGQFRNLQLNLMGILAISAKRTHAMDSKVPKHVAKSSLN